jgi:beta-galactosidase
MPNRPRWLRWPATCPSPDGRVPLAYGADYNPEQWSPEVWLEDVALMREAGVNVVNLGIFSWAQVQPAADEWRFDWLDAVMDLLYEHGIAVDLATGTASPPPWLTLLHPEILPVTADGRVLSPGGRQHWRPTSPIFRQYALSHVATMAERYGEHPALAMWHVSNELGCHNIHDYSDDAATAFRSWLELKYGDVAALNVAWGTAFWSQRYSDWSQILPPRVAASYPNPTQQLDFARFSSDALKQYLLEETAVLRSITPDLPITTNFMVMGETKGMDYADWGSAVDIVSNDHYVQAAGVDGSQELCFSANLVSGISGGDPWFLMEHSTSAVNWQRVNTPKLPGQLRRDSLAHVAHGSDAVSFFQWRQSFAGAEKFHSAMVPHAGTDSRLWRDVVALGEDLAALAEVRGTRSVPSSVALLFDWPSWWASELDSHPSELFRYRDNALAWYRALQDLGVGVDVQPLGADLSPYALVVAPALYIIDDHTRSRLEAYVRSGGQLAATFFSGIVNEHDHIHLGGYPGALRALLGIRVEEFAPLAPGVTVGVDRGGHASSWAERIDIVDETTETILSYSGGDLDGTPAATTRRSGLGRAAYVGADLDSRTLGVVARRLVADAGVVPEVAADVAPWVTRRVRAGDAVRFTFLLNHSRQRLVVDVDDGVELLTDKPVTGQLELEPLGVAVVRSEE